MRGRPAPPEERFWDLVNGPWCDPRVGADDCWIWMGSQGQSRRPKSLPMHKPYKRYGRFWLNGTCVNAHRMALILTGTPPPDDFADASHWKCDQSLCCNFTHLRWETHRANIAQAVTKGRLLRIGTRWAAGGAFA